MPSKGQVATMCGQTLLRMRQKDRPATQTPNARAASCASVVFPQDCEYLFIDCCPKRS